MKSYIEERAIEIANYTIEHNSPVRFTAKAFGVSKSLVHRDLTVILPQVNSLLARKVSAILNINFNDKHNRGGKATQKRWRKQND